VTKDQRDVSSLSRGVLLPEAPPLSPPLQDGLGFFPPLMPARLWARLTARFPLWETYGVAMFRPRNIRVGEARSVHRERVMPMTRKGGLLVPATVPCWLKPRRTFGLFAVTMCIERSPGFAMPPLLAPSPSWC
jgi:hypothetical protein